MKKSFALKCTYKKSTLPAWIKHPLLEDNKEKSKKLQIMAFDEIQDFQRDINIYQAENYGY